MGSPPEPSSVQPWPPAAPYYAYYGCGYPYYGYGYDYPRAIAMFVRPAGPSSGHMRITRIGTSKDVGAVSSGAYNRSTGETAFPGKRKPFVSGFDG